MEENMALGRKDEFYFGASPDILTSCVKVVLPTDCTGGLRLRSKLDLEATILDADGGGKENTVHREEQSREKLAWQKEQVLSKSPGRS